MAKSTKAKKSAKSSSGTIVLQVQTVKLLILVLLTVLLAASLYVLFTNKPATGEAQLIEPVNVTESEESNR